MAAGPSTSGGGGGVDNDFCEELNKMDLDEPSSAHFSFGKPSNSELWQMRRTNESHLAGYNPLRGDFVIEHNNNAEELLCVAGILNSINKDESDENDQKLMEEMQIALVGGYNARLKERQKRKTAIKRLGLINQSATHLWSSRLESALGKSQWKKLIRFSDLLDVYNMDSFYASLESVNEQRVLVNKLIHYRTQHGIRTKIGITVFEMERNKREVPFERVVVQNLVMTPTVKRKKTTRQIFHLPRYKDLSTKEAELCSAIGLNPEFFLDTKDQLILDCRKSNGIPLKRARKLVKIDVNKTRKIFDLLLEQGLIWLPVQ